MVFGITCPRCDGERRDPPCKKCDGRGDLWIYRCPTSQLDPGAARLLSAYGHYQNGHLPSPGGMGDQAASFVHGLSTLVAEKAAIEALG